MAVDSVSWEVKESPGVESVVKEGWKQIEEKT